MLAVISRSYFLLQELVNSSIFQVEAELENVPQNGSKNGPKPNSQHELKVNESIVSDEWKSLQLEQKKLEMCASQLELPFGQSEPPQFARLIDAFLERLRVVAVLEAQIVEGIADETLGEPAALRARNDEVGDNATTVLVSNTISFSPEAA